MLGERLRTLVRRLLGSRLRDDWRRLKLKSSGSWLVLRRYNNVDVPGSPSLVAEKFFEVVASRLPGLDFEMEMGFSLSSERARHSSVRPRHTLSAFRRKARSGVEAEVTTDMLLVCGMFEVKAVDRLIASIAVASRA